MKLPNTLSLFIWRTGFSFQSFLTLNWSLESLCHRKETEGNGQDSKASFARLPAFSTKSLSTQVVSLFLSPACECEDRTTPGQPGYWLRASHFKGNWDSPTVSEMCENFALRNSVANNRLNLRALLWKFMKTSQGKERLSCDSSPLH